MDQDRAGPAGTPGFIGFHCATPAGAGRVMSDQPGSPAPSSASFRSLPFELTDKLADALLLSDDDASSLPPAEPLSPAELAANLAAANRFAMLAGEDVEMQGMLSQ